jgi:hypothetical protein
MNKTLYIIYTEDTGQGATDRAIGIVSAVFPGFTVRRGQAGYWEGKEEKSLVFEIVAFQSQAKDVRALARLLKAELSQVTVMILSLPVSEQFV